MSLARSLSPLRASASSTANSAVGRASFSRVPCPCVRAGRRRRRVSLFPACCLAVQAPVRPQAPPGRDEQAPALSPRADRSSAYNDLGVAYLYVWTDLKSHRTQLSAADFDSKKEQILAPAADAFVKALEIEPNDVSKDQPISI